MSFDRAKFALSAPAVSPSSRFPQNFGKLYNDANFLCKLSRKQILSLQSCKKALRGYFLAVLSCHTSGRKMLIQSRRSYISIKPTSKYFDFFYIEANESAGVC